MPVSMLSPFPILILAEHTMACKTDAGRVCRLTINLETAGPDPENNRHPVLFCYSSLSRFGEHAGIVTARRWISSSFSFCGGW